MIEDARNILKSVFGYRSFYPLQEEIISSVLNKTDTLVVMPTGGGKSLCYQIPALIFRGLTVVVSPLISLMKDQVDQMRELGLNAVLLNSSLIEEEYRNNKNSIMAGNAKLLYVAPETLMKPFFLDFLLNIHPDCFAIDEAHCISHWGHDFRPEYRQLSRLKSLFPDSVCIALTATANKRVRNDIKESLGFKNANEFISSFNRPNLFLDVAPKKNSFRQTMDFLGRFKNQSGIIYCFSRRQVEELYEKLSIKGFSVRPYHAGLSDEERTRNQELFIKDDIQIIVATIAFGMGINKPNVRFILHFDLPKSIESYYQEIGRAGRDGLKSHCLLLYNYGDIRKIQYFIDQKEDEEQRALSMRHLHDMIKYAESRLCRRRLIVTYFGERYSAEKCEACDNCTITREHETDITEISKILLSTTLQTGQRFGVNHIVNILKGSREKKIIQYNHDRLPYYGKCREYSAEQLTGIFIQLTRLGIIVKDFENFGILKLTMRAKDVLEGKLRVTGNIDTDKEEKYKTPKDMPEYDNNLFEVLRKKRKELSDRFNVPPYVIFPDNTLIQMSQFYPRNKNEMMKLNGVGEVKLEKYGDEFLIIILDYIRRNPDLKIIRRPQNDSRESIFTPKHKITSTLYNEGNSPEQIALKFGIKIGTILDHFYKFLVEGNSLRSDGILPLSKLEDSQKVMLCAAFDRHGTVSLKTIFDEFNGQIEYEEIKINRIYYMAKKIS